MIKDYKKKVYNEKKKNENQKHSKDGRKTIEKKLNIVSRV